MKGWTSRGFALVALVMQLAGLGLETAAVTSGQQRPHLIYLLADDYGWNNVGFHASEALTPNIDRLATVDGFELSHLYAYRFCSPTRSSLMSGRLPYHVNQDNSATWGWTLPTIDLRMKTLPQKLQEAGYYTVQAGKWHCGLAKQEFTPAGRGFNESLTMLMGSERHFTQTNGGPNHTMHVDLWHTDAPAVGMNGTYSANLFGGYAVDAIHTHHAVRPNTPLFMYLAFTVTHSPEEAPDQYVNLYPTEWLPGRRLYMGMASALDDAVGNVTAALHSAEMWENTLLIFSSDNGGPALVGGDSNANNHPLRGGKGNAFEGGTRVLACASGGLIPSVQRGRKLPVPMTGHIAMADFYMTFCTLSGHPDCTDSPGNGVPPSESYDMWPLLSGATEASPRTETVLEFRPSSNATPSLLHDAALVQGDWKYIQGRQSGTGWWWGPEYPNSSVKLLPTSLGCPDGCLFNISADVTEHNDLSASYPRIKATLQARLAQLGATTFQSDAMGTIDAAGALSAAERDDWWKPWL
eukprot:m.420597 g.420597  ORF g.420597 m.420597 type:complete len:523 (-) comp32655_c0_seq1:140-1708(-)